MVKKSLRKPEYWEDFEDLCKKLWGEIWQCPEIKKNGRKGQVQKGVDIYGIIQNTNEIVGIQCKGKDEYSHAQLTKKEIELEIEKAKTFMPPLSKFYFATTSNKDSAIEEYIRIKDEENKAEGLFEVHLFSWEDIVEMIDENKQTYDWYVKNQNYKESFGVKFTFGNDKEELTLKPIFIEQRTYYRNKKELDKVGVELIIAQINKGFILFNEDRKLNSKEDLFDYLNTDSPEEDTETFNDPQPVKFSFGWGRNGFSLRKTINKSVGCFRLKLENIGAQVLEDVKVYIEVSNVAKFDSVDKRQGILDSFNYPYNVLLNSQDENKATFKPEGKSIVQGDSILSDELCIKTKTQPGVSILKYKLVSRGFSKGGELVINVNPTFEIKETKKYVENPEHFQTRVTYQNKYTQMDYR